MEEFVREEKGKDIGSANVEKEVDDQIRGWSRLRYGKAKAPYEELTAWQAAGGKVEPHINSVNCFAGPVRFITSLDFHLTLFAISFPLDLWMMKRSSIRQVTRGAVRGQRIMVFPMQQSDACPPHTITHC